MNIPYDVAPGPECYWVNLVQESQTNSMDVYSGTIFSKEGKFSIL